MVSEFREEENWVTATAGLMAKGVAMLDDAVAARLPHLTGIAYRTVVRRLVPHSGMLAPGREDLYRFHVAEILGRAEANLGLHVATRAEALAALLDASDANHGQVNDPDTVLGSVMVGILHSIHTVIGDEIEQIPPFVTSSELANLWAETKDREDVEDRDAILAVIGSAASKLPAETLTSSEAHLLCGSVEKKLAKKEPFARSVLDLAAPCLN